MFIILASAMPGLNFQKLPAILELFHPDKLIHLFIFGVYVFLQIRGFRRQPVFPSIRRNAVWMTLLIGLILAAGTELLQNYFVQMRYGSIYDFIANIAGCLIGWWIARKFIIKNS